MSEIMTFGMDLAKEVIHVVGFDSPKREVVKKALRRKAVEPFFVNRPECTIAMEACSGAHEWARRLQAQGHRVVLIPPRFAKVFLDGNKNDYNDARAIAEASWSPRLRPVPIKTREQQGYQAVHRFRRARIQDRTALCNQLRGLMAEYGMVLPKGVATLRRHLPSLLEDAENGLGVLDREILASGYEQLRQLDTQIEHFTRLIKEQSRTDATLQTLQTAPGFGPIVASAFRGHVGDGKGFRTGRDVSASLGIVPAQHSTGGRARLLGISKRGDRYVRCLLIHGARSVIRQSGGKGDALSRWIQRLIETRGVNKATVALANKLARVGWAILRYGTVYDPKKVITGQETALR